jgi:hypothetical protein
MSQSCDDEWGEMYESEPTWQRLLATVVFVLVVLAALAYAIAVLRDPPLPRATSFRMAAPWAHLTGEGPPT